MTPPEGPAPDEESPATHADDASAAEASAADAVAAERWLREADASESAPYADTRDLTLHADARRVLSSWTPDDEEQRDLRDSYVDFLDAHPDAMWRACVEGHLTGSTLVVSHDRSHVLLTLHSKIGRWLQMGGHCEPGDATLRAAAAREALEESGIAGLELSGVPVRLDRHRVGCHGGSWHLDVQYVAVAAPDAVEVISEESLDLRWWPVDALPHDTDDALRALVTAALHPSPPFS